MIEAKKCEYDTAVEKIIAVIPELSRISADVKRRVNEIRLRAGQPVVLTCGNRYYPLQKKLSPQEIERCVTAFCENSVHSYEKELANGVLTLMGGHRAAFSGTAVYEDGRIVFIKNVSSLNIRIARQHFGCADGIMKLFCTEKPPNGLLLLGKPLSGKTTILRDLCRTLGQTRKLSLIDERGEIAAVYSGMPQLDVGLMTDIFTRFDKKDGLIRAIKGMSPDYVVTDELGADCSLIEQCVNCGTGVIMSAHSRNLGEALVNTEIRRLLSLDIITHIVALSSEVIGKVDDIYMVEGDDIKAIREDGLSYA